MSSWRTAAAAGLSAKANLGTDGNTLMIAVGLLVIALSIRTIVLATR